MSFQNNINLIDNAFALYKKYYLLHIFNNNVSRENKGFNVNDGSKSLIEIINDHISNLKAGINQTDIQVDIDKTNYNIHIDLTDIHKPKVNFKDLVYTEPLTNKEFSKYRSDDLPGLLEGNELFLERDKKGNYNFATTIKVDNVDYQIGGQKIDLYLVHIKNLYEQIRYYSNPKANYQQLIPMATGSGKSFTSAMTFMQNALTGKNSIFAVPTVRDKDQLEKDFKRLVPEELLTKMQSEGKLHFYTHEELLQKQFEALSKASEEDRANTVISIDESHKAMRIKLYKERVKELSALYPKSMVFLTATPTKDDFELAGNKPLAVQSLKDKIESGVSVATKIGTKKTKEPIREWLKTRPSEKGVKNKLKQFGQSVVNKVVDGFVKAHESPAHEYANYSLASAQIREKDDPYFYQIQDLKNPADITNGLMFNVQLAIARRKQLISVNGYEDIINLNLISNSNMENPFEDGNRTMSRMPYYNTFGFGMSNLDLEYDKEREDNQKKIRKGYFVEFLTANTKMHEIEILDYITRNIDYESDVKEMNEYKVYHGMIDLTLKFLTDQDLITINQKRFNNLKGLTTECFEALSKLNNTALHQKIKNYLKKNDIKGPLQDEIAKELQNSIDRMREISKNRSDVGKETFVQNFTMSKKLHEEFDEITKSELPKYKTVYFFDKDIKKGEMSFEKDTVFNGLTEKNFTLSEPGTDEEKIAANRKLGFMELIDDNTRQYYYKIEKENKLNNLDRQSAVGLYKLGLIPTLASNELRTAFNDLDTHSHFLLASNESDESLKPDELTQAAGRTRGKDPTVIPEFGLFIHKNIKKVFPVKKLNDGDYFSSLFKFGKIYHKQALKNLANHIFDLVNDEYAKHLNNEDNSLDTKGIEKKCIDIFMDEYEKLYNENNHDLEKTKKEFISIMQELDTGLRFYDKKLRSNFKLEGLFTKICMLIFPLIRLLCYYFPFSLRGVYNKMIKEMDVILNDKSMQNLGALEDLTNDDDQKKSIKYTYAFIVKNYPFNDLLKVAITGKVTADLFIDKAKIIEKVIKDATEKKLIEIMPQITKFESFLQLYINNLSSLNLMDVDQLKQDFLEKLKVTIDENDDFYKFISDYINKNIKGLHLNDINSLDTFQSNLANEIKIWAENKAQSEITPDYLNKLLTTHTYPLLTSPAYKNCLKEIQKLYKNRNDKDFKNLIYCMNPQMETENAKKLIDVLINIKSEDDFKKFIIVYTNNASSIEEKFKKLHEDLEFVGKLFKEILKTVAFSQGTDELGKHGGTKPALCCKYMEITNGEGLPTLDYTGLARLAKGIEERFGPYTTMAKILPKIADVHSISQKDKAKNMKTIADSVVKNFEKGLKGKKLDPKEGKSESNDVASGLGALKQVKNTDELQKNVGKPNEFYLNAIDAFRDHLHDKTKK